MFWEGQGRSQSLKAVPRAGPPATNAEPRWESSGSSAPGSCGNSGDHKAVYGLPPPRKVGLIAAAGRGEGPGGGSPHSVGLRAAPLQCRGIRQRILHSTLPKVCRTGWKQRL